jgi:radical SAM superfamily enzyme YgiQ (UPF0313 family)
LKAYCKGFADNIFIEAFNINQPDDYILRRLYKNKPDILGFSCYIWNIEKTARIASAIRLLLPDALIIFGGPEMKAEYEPYIEKGIADIIIPGEGEKPLSAILNGNRLTDIGGIVCAPALLCANPKKNAPFPLKPLDLSDIPFPYPQTPKAFENKILYYEASRGCSSSCAYCTSGGQQLRLKPLETVFNELAVFIGAHVKRVKFTDRTFNAREDFAMAIWRYLAKRDNGITCFHFEIAADLLSEDAVTLLGQTRAGLFQFEIGVQSVNPGALKTINRKTDLTRLFENVKKIKTINNIHLHLDLIAGLPGETLDSFIEGFNAVYDLSPHHIQLGFLKLLKGTPLRENAQKLGLIHSPCPPYEILSTPHLSYDDLLLLKSVAKMMEVFYNAGKFTYTLNYLRKFFPSGFSMYECLAGFWFAHGFDEVSHGKIQTYKILYDFAREHIPHETILLDLLRFDLLLNENEKSLPDWLAPNGERSTHKRRVPFKTDIFAWLGNTQGEPAERDNKLTFIYPSPGRQNPLTALERVSQEWKK